LIGVVLRSCRISFYLSGDHVVGDEITKEIEPEKGNLGQYTPLVGNACCKHVIERRDAIGGYEEEMRTVEIVDIPDLAAGVELEFGEVSAQQDRVEKAGAHVGILQLENVAYSNLSEIFVNDLSSSRTPAPRIPLKEKVLTAGEHFAIGFYSAVWMDSVCGKAEDGRG
jgi:hypothetical protein